MSIAIKRVYDAPAASDGERILVDRIWPRGLTKAKAQISAWLKDVAPSTELRKWFGHDPERWAEFRQRYLKELTANAEAAGDLKERAKHSRVTLVFAAHDAEHNNAVVLADWLERG